jgi:hypothetical protein
VNDDGERGGTDGRSMQVLMPRHCACIPSLRSPNGTEHGIAVNPSSSGSQRPYAASAGQPGGKDWIRLSL